MATTNDLKNGMTLDIEGQLWTVVEFQHVKPGKGPAFVRTKLKQVLSGKVVDKTFNAGVKVEVASLEKREMNFLYKEGEDFVFMDNKTFDQMNISSATVGDAAQYMLENTEAIVAIHDNNPLYIELPASVTLQVTYTEQESRETARQVELSQLRLKQELKFRYPYLLSKMRRYLLILVMVRISVAQTSVRTK